MVRVVDREADKNKKNNFVIPLTDIYTSKNDKKLVNFFAVPKSAFQTVDYLKLDGKMLYHENMI